MMAMTMLMAMVKGQRPHREVIMVAKPSISPMPSPQARTTSRWARASAKAGRISLPPCREMAKAKTAFR